MQYKLSLSHHAMMRARQFGDLLKEGHGVGDGIVEAGNSYTFTVTDRRNVTLLAGDVEPVTEIQEYVFRAKRPGRKKRI